MAEEKINRLEMEKRELQRTVQVYVNVEHYSN